MDARLGQSLVNSGLISSERSATLEHQGDGFEGNVPLRRSGARLDLNVHTILSSSWRQEG
jgi:hypothetical protein